MLSRPEPIIVVDLFPLERAALLQLLQALDGSDRQRPTACPGWAVRDIAAHLVADDLGRLSRQRDGYRPERRRANEGLVSLIDRQNAEWVEAMRRISPAVLVTLLDVGGGETQRFFETLDPHALGGPVWWATGNERAPVWLDLARELTERWHHHQQIRDAVGSPPLTDPRVVPAVMATFARALPRTFREVRRPEGTAVTLVVNGAGGGTWSIVFEEGTWRLYDGHPPNETARVELAQNDYWRLVTKGITPAAAASRGRLTGDVQLARKLLRTVAIIG